MKSGGTLLKPLIWLPKFDHCDLRSTWTVPLSDWRLQSRDGCLLVLVLTSRPRVGIPTTSTQ